MPRSLMARVVPSIDAVVVSWKAPIQMSFPPKVSSSYSTNDSGVQTRAIPLNYVRLASGRLVSFRVGFGSIPIPRPETKMRQSVGR